MFSIHSEPFWPACVCDVGVERLVGTVGLKCFLVSGGKRRGGRVRRRRRRMVARLKSKGCRREGKKVKAKDQRLTGQTESGIKRT